MGKPQGGNAHIFSHTFYAWEKMRIIYVEKNAYYAWEKNTVGMPTFFPRIYCVGKTTHIMHGQTPLWECPRKKCAFYAWAKMRIKCVGKNMHIMHGQTPLWECPRIKCAFYAWATMRIFYVGKNTHNMHGKNPLWECPRIKCAYYAWGFPCPTSHVVPT